MRNYQQQICRPHIINNYDKTYKVITVGDSFSGKTSLLSVLADANSFSDIYTSTIGVDFVAIKTNIIGKKIKLQVWDTAGQENFAPLIKSYYKDIVGAIIVFDVANRSSFNHLKFWLKELENNSNAIYPLHKVLIGNKIDIYNRVISYEEAKAFADEHNLLYQETSVRDNINVQNTFMELCEEIYKNKDLNTNIVINNESYLSLNSKIENKNRTYYDCCNIS